MNWPIFITGLVLTTPGIVGLVLFIRGWREDNRQMRAGIDRNEAELNDLIAHSYTDADEAWLDAHRITL